MGFGKTQISTKRAAGAHPDIGDILFHLGQHRQMLLHQGRAFNGAMSRRAADEESAIF